MVPELASTNKALTAESVRNANAAIGTSEAIEENLKTVTDIHLATNGKDVDNFTPEQATALFAIANQCPMIGGNAVFKARSLYALIDDTQEFDDVLLCLPHGIVVKSLHVQPDIVASIIPNPASDEATLVLSREMEGSSTLIMYDAIGAEVLQSSIPGRTTRLAFSTAALAPGLYHYKVLGAGGVIGNGKLTIVR